MDSVDEILNELETDSILSKVALSDSDISLVLELRDRDSFDLRWMHNFSAVEAQKMAAGIQGGANSRVERIRELAYLHAFARWNSPELASYISDDFGLVADAQIVNFHSDWLDWLLTCYRQGVVPVESLHGKA